MTGVADSHLNVLKEKALRELHGSLIDEIAELATAIDMAASAVEAGRDSTRIDTGMTAEQFDAAAKPIEQRQSVAWLRRRDGEMRVVDLERRVEREAQAPQETEELKGRTHSNPQRGPSLERTKYPALGEVKCDTPSRYPCPQVRLKGNRA